MTVIGCGFLLAVGIVVVFALASVIAPLDTPILGDLHYNCTVGVVGTAASVTVQGIFAGRQCRAWLHDSEGQPGQFFELTQTPAQPVVCEYSHARLHFTVRDSGILKVVGNGICQSLRTMLAEPYDSHDLTTAGIPVANNAA
jgi:hypothetical protein